MDTPEIIFTCLAICLILLSLVCCFFACLYYSTTTTQKTSKQQLERRKIRSQSTVAHLENQNVNKTSDINNIERQNGKEELEKHNVEEEKRKVSHPSPIVVVPKKQISGAKSVNRPTNLLIETTPQMTAKSAQAIETDHATEHFLREMSEPNENRSRLLSDEFEVLSKTEARRTARTGEKAAKNPDFNRYADIVPYDHTLVELSRGQYINASFVQGENDALRFIATQAPIGAEENRGIETVSDFWLMIVQQNVECIVMLTDIFENYMQKCSLYWPVAIGTTKHFNGIRVTLVSENERKRVVRREFDVVYDDDHRKHQVSQFQFKNWVDNDAPDFQSFLDFLMDIRSRNYKSPILVHCSAGIGRTGVFICTDNIISRIQNEGIIDVFSEVNRARQQRPRMVHNLTQYESIYDIISLYLKQRQ